MDCVHGAVWRIPVVQADHHFARWSEIDSGHGSDWPLDQRLVIVADSNDREALRPHFGTHRPKGPRNIVFREEMRKRVVTRDHDVVYAREALQIANVARRESNVQATTQGFQASAVQSSFTDVCSVDPISVAGESKCLGADPTRAIKNGLSIRQPASY